MSAADRLAQAIAAAREAVKVRDTWEERADAAQAAVDRLESQAGARALDDPDGAQGLVAELTEARASLAVAVAAVPEAEERARVAVATACRVEADSLDRERKQAQAAVGRFDAREAELRAALEEHTGRPWHMVDEAEELAARGETGRVFAGHRWSLVRAVRAVERRQALLRGVAAGQDAREVLPDATWDDLGQCLRPGGPADLGWLSPEEAEREAAEAAEAEVAEARAELEAALSEAVTVAREWAERRAGAGADRLDNDTMEAWEAARLRLRRAQQAWHNTPGATGVRAEALMPPPRWPTDWPGGDAEE